MNRKIVFVTGLLLVIIIATAGAQSTECKAQQFFVDNQGCLSENRGRKCVELDVSHTLDKEGKEFEYAWNFGDGTIRKGVLTSYCYQQYGTYQITLDLVDPKTNQVIRNELTTRVHLFPPIQYLTDTLKEMHANFDYDSALLPQVKVQDIFWKIEDTYTCGQTAQHTFKDSGMHMIEIGVQGTLPDNSPFSGCTLMAVYIEKKK